MFLWVRDFLGAQDDHASEIGEPGGANDDSFSIGVKFCARNLAALLCAYNRAQFVPALLAPHNAQRRLGRMGKNFLQWNNFRGRMEALQALNDLDFGTLGCPSNFLVLHHLYNFCDNRE